MSARRYYSIRTGKNPLSAGIDLSTFAQFFLDIYVHFVQQQYFQEAFGYDCVDAGYVAGILGGNIEAQMLRKLRKRNLWPIEERCLQYSEDDIFDVIEFLFDCVSRPVDGFYHSYGSCGWHYSEFNKEAGRTEFREEVNQIMSDYGDGFTLSEEGEVLITGRPGLNLIFQATISTSDPEKVDERVAAAITKFRRHRSTVEDRLDAVRDLVGVLEFLRPKIKELLTKKDEDDLFILANKFGIRHHDASQQTDYDKPIWYSWMFYYYLATIHAVTRLIEQRKTESTD